MKHIVAEVVLLSNGCCIPSYTCFSDEKLDEVVSRTLLDLISEIYPPGDSHILSEFSELLKAAQESTYISKNLALSDFCINDKFVDLLPPRAPIKGVHIYNGNTEDEADFSYEQVWAAIRHWVLFAHAIEEHGMSAMLGKKHNIALPS
ncbi:hypothetical protein HNE05_08080 [Aquipseudomonas campi]|uniref:Uncharacterized protein n=1 Tax=Aquipseudomonas campi TaxID=2731681 RepID=A0A6M8FGA2_9GAMM|nr:hypothetical protein [Pseudomonas campi]QKE63322.1 hypothetical protein HNE05_08080 [Pseudomonas campi]